MHFELTNHLGSSAAAVGVLGNNDVHALEWTVAYHAGYVNILHALNLAAHSYGADSGDVM